MHILDINNNLYSPDRNHLIIGKCYEGDLWNISLYDEKCAYNIATIFEGSLGECKKAMSSIQQQMNEGKQAIDPRRPALNGLD